MQKYNDLKSLRVLELSILLEHVRLGQDHLKKYLNQQQFGELLEYGRMSQKQHETINSAQAEKSGSFALALNTIFTCIIGTWLGTAGFIGIGLGSTRLLLTITTVAALSSGLLGYYNYKITTQKNESAIINQKLHNIQFGLMQLIAQKYQHSIKKIIQYLNETLYDLNEFSGSGFVNIDEELNNFDSKENILKWVKQLSIILEKKAETFGEEAIYKLYAEELINAKTKLARLVKKRLPITEKTSEKTIDTKDKVIKHLEPKEEQHTANNFIEVLTDPTIAMPKFHPQKRSWIKSKFWELLVGFLPTALGGFSSVFIYFGGIPDIAKQCGVCWMKEVTTRPYARPIEFIVALTITLYFGYTFARTNYKNFQREQELSNTQKNITNQETTLVEISAKVNFLKKLRAQVNHIAHTFTILKHLCLELQKRK